MALSFGSPNIQADVSSYGAKPNAQGNPFGVMSDFVQMQGGMQRNALYAQELQLKQQEFMAKRAMGEIMQQNVDPATGEPNWTNASIQMATDPRTAFMAPAFIKDLMERQKLDAELFGAKLKNSQDTLSLLSNAWTPIVKEMESNNGVLPPDPQDPSKADLTELYNQAALLTATNPDLADAALGILTKLKMADRQQASQMVGDMAKSTLISKLGLDGVSAALDVKGVDPMTGAETTTHGRIDRMSGEFSPYTASKPPGSEMALPELPEAPKEASDTGTNAGTMKPMEPKPEALPGITEGGALTTQTSLDPFRAGQIKDISEKYVPELNDRVKDANQLLALMSQVKGELKDFKPGGGAELRVQLGTLADALGMPEDVKNTIAMGDLGSAQAARKLFFGIGSQMAAQLIRAGGGRMTQTEWAQTLAKGSPNLDLTPDAINKIFSAMKELAHYTQLEQKAFNDYRKRGGDVVEWGPTWSELLNELIERREKMRGSNGG